MQRKRCLLSYNWVQDRPNYFPLFIKLMKTLTDIKRFNMIEQQIRTWDIFDVTILNLYDKIKRENYVPSAYKKLAFTDVQIPLMNEQYMLAPKQEAKVLQSLKLKPSNLVLHVGTGSGFFAAMLASLSKHVVTMDVFNQFLIEAKLIHQQDNLYNLTYINDDGIFGHLESAPYDVIVFTGGLQQEPVGLREQLNIGGKLFLFEGNKTLMKANLIEKVGSNEYEVKSIFEDVVPLLVSKSKSSKFVF